LSLGSVTVQAMGADFFDGAQYPAAQFQADIARIDDGYVATGTLKIRDKALPVSLPFTLNIVDGIATMQGQLEVNRMDFDIGLGVKDEASLALSVLITVALSASAPS
ncbi:MAG: YceI family protein, partial [Paracoccaceae bacterium]